MANIDALNSVNDARFAWGPASLIDASLDRISSLAHRIDKGVYDSYLKGYKRLSEMEFKGNSVVMAAMKAPLYELGLDMGDRIAYVRIPPTYIVREGLLKEADGAVEAAFGRAMPIRAPFKTLAVALGLGHYGKNNIVYVPGMGSYVRLRCYIAEDDNGASSDKCTNFIAHGFGAAYMAEECVSCQNCATSCPTNAVLADGFMVDAGRCITYANEEEGPFPDWVSSDHHNCLVGCMRCQEVCPMNHGKLETVTLEESLDADEARRLLMGCDDLEGRFKARISAKFARIGLDYDVDIIRRNLMALKVAGKLR